MKEFCQKNEKKSSVNDIKIKKGEVSPSLQPALRSYATPSSGGNPRNAPNIKFTKKSPYEKNLQTESESAKKLGRSKGSADKTPKHK